MVFTLHIILPFIVKQMKQAILYGVPTLGIDKYVTYVREL